MAVRNHMDLLRSIDLAGARQAGSVLPSALPRFALLARLLERKGLARQNPNGRWFATSMGRQRLRDIGIDGF